MELYNPGASFRFTSPWSIARKHPVSGVVKAHRGEDWAATSGTLISAAGDGIVVYTGSLNGYGNLIVLEHVAKDDGEIVHTLYAHMIKRSHLKKNTSVRCGDSIGLVGNSGTGAHLHFEILRNGKKGSPNLVKGHETVNPREFDISRIRCGKTASTTIANDKPSLTSNFNFPVVNEKANNIKMRMLSINY